MKRLALFLLLFPLAGWLAAQDLVLPETTPGCNTEQVELDAGEGFESYEWSTGETTQTITVDEEGVYSVTVFDGESFQTADTEVVFLDYMVEPDGDATVCPNEELILHVVPEIYDVVWQPGNVENDTLIVYPTEEQTYNVTIADGDAVCEESFTLDVYPAMDVDIDQINDICFGQCEGQVIASVTGGEKPYDFLWNDEVAIWDSIATELCAGENQIQITDANQCTLDTTFVIEALPAAEVEVSTSPTDTLYLENPTLTFSFENLSDTEITEWMWVFETPNGDTLFEREETYTFSLLNELEELPNSIPVLLEVVNEFGCDTLATIEVPLQEAELKIPNVLTPNGDGYNDIFHVQNAKNGNDIRYEYISVELYVYNRHGRMVYQDKNYQNDWDARGLSDGTYFYVLHTNGYYRDDDYRGVITIIGSGN